MITILIVDDEKLIRAGIKKILGDDIQIPISLIEAKNGEEALEICKNDMPDLLITDIRMPRMDGVELMHALAKLELKPAIIILSGFDDFAYAKEAISYGAVSYILKPVDRKELVSAVSTTIAKVSAEEKKRNQKLIQSIVEQGRLENSVIPSSFEFANGLCVACVVGKKVATELSRILKPVSFYFLEQKKEFVSVVIPREGIYLLDSDLSSSSFSIGISAFSDNLSSLRSLNVQAFVAMLQRFFSVDSRSQSDGDVSNVNKKTGLWYFSEQSAVQDFSLIDSAYEKCICRLDISSPSEIKASIDNVFDFSKVPQQQQSAVLYYLYNKATNNLLKRFPGYSDTDMYLHLKGIMIENIWLFSELSEWKNCLCDYAVYLSALLKQNTSEYPFITQALDYISKHYTTNLNMAMVANQVSVNYTWFSEKFKEHTGVNFNEYLKRLRLDEAKRLLEKGCYKVYEVSQRSGFGDVKYFMKTFRESTGMTPSEYRRLASEKSLSI